MKKIILSVLTFCFFANSTSAFGDDKSPQKDQPFIFDVDIFSLSKKKEDAFDAASSVYVLTSEDIRRSGANSIPEALRLVPGLQVARIDGHKWAISARGFNAQFSNKLLVMIDGRTVYTPLFSGSFWDVQDYVLEDIEKVEVIRGSGGAIWGANAVNGIINIITKNAIDTQGGYASVVTGNEEKGIFEVRYGGRTKSLNHYRLYAKQLHVDELKKINDGADNDDGYRHSQAGFRYDIRSIKDNNIAVHGDIRTGKANNYFNLYQAGSVLQPTHKESKGGNFVVNWDKTISDKSSFTLKSYLDYDQFDTYILERSSKTFDVDFQHFYDFNDRNQFIWGVGYRLIRDKIGENSLSNNVVALGYTPDKKNDEILSAFLQDKIGIIKDKLYLTLGSKFEHNDFTGFEYQPSAKLTIYPSRNQTIWTSVSRAVRTPTRGEEGLNLSNGAQIGSATYGVEKITAYELGYRIKPTRKSLIDIAVFYNDYDDLRTFDVEGSSAVANNSGDGYSVGAELTAKWQVLNNWRLEAGYDFLKLDVKNKLNVSELPAIKLAEGQSPNHQFRLRSNLDITPKLKFDNIFYYVDDLPLSGHNATTLLGGVSSYKRFDTRIGYLLNPNIDLSVGIKNITDSRHQEFTNGTFANKTEVGRTFYFKTTLWF